MKDKQRAFMPSLVNNETYGTILSSGAQQPGSPAAPPLPPRNLGTQPRKGRGIKTLRLLILPCVVAQGQWNLQEVFSMCCLILHVCAVYLELSETSFKCPK